MKIYIKTILLLILSVSPLQGQVVLQALEGGDDFTVDGWNIVLQPKRYLVSVKDDNYLPMDIRNLTSQPVTAELGEKDVSPMNLGSSLNYQGVIAKNNGFTYPFKWYEVFNSKIYLIQAKLYKNKDTAPPIKIKVGVLAKATIPAKYIKNSNQDETVSLIYTGESAGESESTFSEDKTINLYIVADNKDLELVQLDMNKGLGQDGQGILLTSFYLANQKMDLRLIPAIPDRYAGTTVMDVMGGGSDYHQHEMFYMPVMIDNKVWLNLDLGDSFNSLLSRPDFDPVRTPNYNRPFNPNTIPRFSAFQWLRKADGHEFSYFSTQGHEDSQYYLPGSTTVRAENWNGTTPPEIIGKDIIVQNAQSWVEGQIGLTAPQALWRQSGNNNPCPDGFYVPLKQDWELLINKMKAQCGQNNNIKDCQTVLPNYYEVTFDNPFPKVTIIYGHWTSSVAPGREAWVVSLDKTERGGKVKMAKKRWYYTNRVRCVKAIN